MERAGEAFELGEQLTVLGGQLSPGDAAPEFELDHLDPVSGTLGTVRLSDSAGSVRLLNIVNSLDTPVCEVETRRWEDILRDLPGDIVMYTISMDLPFAQARWCGAEQSSPSPHREGGAPGSGSARPGASRGDIPPQPEGRGGGREPVHRALSAHREEQFGVDYGVLIKEWRLLQRVVVVVGKSGRVEYAEYVRDQMAEPDYEAAIEAVRRAAAIPATA